MKTLDMPKIFIQENLDDWFDTRYILFAFFKYCWILVKILKQITYSDRLYLNGEYSFKEIVNFEDISHLFLVFPLLYLKKYMMGWE